MEPILTVAFIIAVTAFFKERFKLNDGPALAAAFGVSLIVGLAPIVSASLPALAPWIDSTLNVVVLFLSAAGGYDALKDLIAK